MMILVLCGFCLAGFANTVQQQDTSLTRQDTTKRHTKKMSPARKNPKNKDWSKRDTMKKNNSRMDTIAKPPQP